MLGPVQEPPVERPADQSEPPGFALPGLAVEAWRFAAVAHGGQRRRGSGSPYIEHPVAVARLVVEHGGDEAMVAAAFLHDVLEDTDVASERIHGEFGDASRDLRVASAAALFAEILRQSPHVNELTYADVLALLAPVAPTDEIRGLREMVLQAQRLAKPASLATTQPQQAGLIVATPDAVEPAKP